MMDSRIYKEDVERIVSADLPWEDLEGTEILITGATGMIGSMLVDVLMHVRTEVEFRTVAVSRNMEQLKGMFERYEGLGLELVEHDLNVSPMKDCFDTIFHCASNTHPLQYSQDPIGTITTNVIGLKNLLDRMKVPSDRGRFVFLSSVEIYGDNRGDVEKFDESYCGYIDCNTARAGYNESKRVGESLCQAYISQKGVDCVIPRLSRSFGPSLRRTDTKALSQFLFNAVEGEDIVLKSAGTQRYSYVYSADAVEGLLYTFFHGGRGEAYNIAGFDDTLFNIASTLAESANVDLVFEEAPDVERKGYSPATVAVLDCSKMESLGWRAEHDLAQSLSRTVRSLREQYQS